MQGKRRFYITSASVLPWKYRNYVSNLILFSGEKELTADDWLGSANLLALLGFLAFLLVPLAIAGQNFWLYLFFGITFAILSHVMVVVLLNIKMEDRSERIEQVLPDFLQLTAANVRAGMTPFIALKYSSKKEFGPLKDEIDFIVSKSLSTVNFADVILSMSKRIKSTLLERTLRLFTNAIRTGGHIATLLEDIAKDIIETRSLKRELVTNTKAYTMFIMFMVILGTPLLLSISLAFLQNMLTLQPERPVETSFAGTSGLINEIKITLPFMTRISIIFLVITGFLSGVLMGVIKEGSFFYGTRYTPAIIISSVILFFILNYLVSGFLA